LPHSFIQKERKGATISLPFPHGNEGKFDSSEWRFEEFECGWKSERMFIVKGGTKLVWQEITEWLRLRPRK
jgi:hypothetical protein